MIWWIGQVVGSAENNPITSLSSHVLVICSWNHCPPSSEDQTFVSLAPVSGTQDSVTFSHFCQSLFSCEMPYFQSCPPGISFYVFTPSYLFSLTGFLPFGRLKRAPDISNLITSAEVLDCGRSRARVHIICCSVMQGSCF